jgi:hypothetical protein
MLFWDGQVLLDVQMVGLRMSWDPFVQGICAQEMLPRVDRIWNDCSGGDLVGV